MTNIKFPHFDFYNWLYMFSFLIENIKLSVTAFEEELMVGNWLEEMKHIQESFFAQIHNERDDSESWDIPSLFLEKMIKFNLFMIYLDSGPCRESIYGYINAVHFTYTEMTDDMKKNIDTVLKLLEIIE